MDSSWTSKLGPVQFKSAVLRAWDVLWTTSNTGIKPSEKFQRLCFFLKGGEGTSAAQPIDEPASISSNNAIMGMAHTSPMDRGGLLESNHGTDDPKDELISPEKLKRALAQMQINISDAVESEPLTPPTKDMEVDPTPLDTTTMCNADTLPEYHAGDNGLRERNLYSSDTKNDRISISSSISLSQDSVSNSHFPGTKSLISTTWLLPNLLKVSFEPHSAKRGLHDFIQVDPPVLSIGCLVVQLKLDQLVIDVVDHRAPTMSTHGKKFSCPFMMDVAVAVHHAKFYHGRFDRRDIGVAVLRTTIPVLRQTQSPRLSLSDFLMLHACCISCCYWMVMSTQSKPDSTSFQGGRRCRQCLNFPAACWCQAFNFVHFSLSLCERRCQTIKARGVD